MGNNSPQQTYNQQTLRRILKTVKGNIYSINIPRPISEPRVGVKYTVEVLGDDIILRSGLDLVELKSNMTQRIEEIK